MSCPGHKVLAHLTSFIKMWLVAIIRKKHQACFFSLQPLSVKETKSGSIMFKKMWQAVSCLQKHENTMFAKNLTVSCLLKTLTWYHV